MSGGGGQGTMERGESLETCGERGRIVDNGVEALIATQIEISDWIEFNPFRNPERIQGGLSRPPNQSTSDIRR